MRLLQEAYPYKLLDFFRCCWWWAFLYMFPQPNQ